MPTGIKASGDDAMDRIGEEGSEMDGHDLDMRREPAILLDGR